MPTGHEVGYRLDVWEQFLDGRGGRYKIEGEVELDASTPTETTAELLLEKGIALRVRLLPGGKVLGDSAPVFPKPLGRKS